MARKIVNDMYYTFNPATRTLVLNEVIPRENLILVTDVTADTVIYNFSDPNLKATSYTIATDSYGNPTTTIVFNYNTASLSSTDKIQVLIDEYEEKFSPGEVVTDPVGKFRVSTPQALIDTDFEYSTQPTKWESLNLVNNRPFAYYSQSNALTYTDITATNGSRSYVVATTTPPAAGTVVFIQDTLYAGADGLYIIDSVIAGTSFTYTGKYFYTGSTGSINISGVTQIFTGSIFTGASIGISSITNSGTVVTVTTSIPHGLVLGNEIALTGTSASSNAPNGSWLVATVATPTTFTFIATNAPTGSITGGTLYNRPLGNFLHRAYDGGVTFSTNANSHNQQLMRQTRRYFRYQSGKGIQMSTGTLLRPAILIDQLSASGSTVTVTSKFPHNLAPGVTVQTTGCNESAYNGSFTVATVVNPYQFTYTALSSPSASPASGLPYVSVTGWYGATSRVGMFDSQNGMFWEYDGSTLYAVKRYSTYQIGGYVNITAGSNTVTGQTVNGVTTTFSKQLFPGDFIVIKGMTYRVDTISSDTSMTIQPSYRGATNLTYGIISKTVDVKYPQSLFNLDRLDGTGASGYNIDLSRMQMFYMDYSWYGAGYIRWGVRTTDGRIVYAQRIQNNNLNFQAYMRSGNLPGRYETNTFSKQAIITSTLNSGDTSVNISDTTNWPTAGTILVRGASAYEYITYTGKSQVASLSATLTSGSTTVAMTNTTGVVAGQYIVGTGIPQYSYVTSVSTNVSIVISQAATVTGTQTLAFAPTLTGLTRGQAGGSLSFTTTSGSSTITGASTSGIQVGQYVSGTGITPYTYVVSFVANTSVLLSTSAAASGTATLVFSPMASTATTFTYSATAPVAVELHSPSYSPVISHWGTSVIMDGRFDDDKSYVFTKGMTTSISITNGVNNALMSFRICPTVSAGVGGTTLGSRELINRMQMVLRTMDVFSNGSFLITFVLNGTVSSATPNWANVGGSSLAQYINHTAATTITGGETVFGFYLNTAGGSTNYTTTSTDLALVRDLGTSILSGGAATANTNVYPDGPDMITVMAQNIGSGASNIFGRMSWTEAQA